MTRRPSPRSRLKTCPQVLKIIYISGFCNKNYGAWWSIHLARNDARLIFISLRKKNTYHDSCWLLMTRGDLSRLMLIHCDSCWLMLTHYDSWWLMLTHVDSCWLMLTHYDSWWLMFTHYYSWSLMLTPYDSWWLITTHVDSS